MVMVQGYSYGTGSDELSLRKSVSGSGCDFGESRLVRIFARNQSAGDFSGSSVGKNDDDG